MNKRIKNKSVINILEVIVRDAEFNERHRRWNKTFKFLVTIFQHLQIICSSYCLFYSKFSVSYNLAIILW